MPKCAGCGTRGEPHEINGQECLDMQYERAWKNRQEEFYDDMELLAGA